MPAPGRVDAKADHRKAVSALRLAAVLRALCETGPEGPAHNTFSDAVHDTRGGARDKILL